MNARLALLLIAAAATVSLVVGCGGGDGDSGQVASTNASSTGNSSKSPSSKAAFVGEANTICRTTALEAVQDMPQAAPGESEPDALAKGIHVVLVPAFQAAHDRLAELRVPVGEDAQVEAFLVAMQHDIDRIDQGRRTFAELDDVDDEFHRSSKLAREFGVLFCAFAA